MMDGWMVDNLIENVLKITWIIVIAFAYFIRTTD